MALRSGHRNIGELFAAARATEHQPAAAHVSSSCKLGGEEKPPSENVQQGFDIFRRGDAADGVWTAIATIDCNLETFILEISALVRERPD